MYYNDVREKRYKFKSVVLIKRTFIEYRKTFTVHKLLFIPILLPDIKETVVKVQYIFIKKINTDNLQFGFETVSRFIDLGLREIKYKIRKELAKCE